MSEVLPPKRQASVDRLRRRVEVYTKDHQERLMHYERIGPTLCDQQMHESFALKQKYLDPKAKKSGSGSSKSSKNNNSGGGGGSGSSSSSSSNAATSSGGVGSNSNCGGNAERKPATDSHASNTQSVREITFSFLRIIDMFFLLFFLYLRSRSRHT